MVKVAENLRAAFLFARVLLVCSLFAILCLAPPARADAYEYTVTFGSALYLSNGFKLTMAISFVAPSLLDGTATNIDPNDVHVLEAPSANAPTGSSNTYLPAPSSLASVSVSNQEVDVQFIYQVCQNDDCNGTNPVRWTRTDDYSAYFAPPITGTGVFQPFHSQLIDSTFGSNPLGESYSPYGNYQGQGDSVSVMITPEPNTGFIVGTGFLCCSIIALRRRHAQRQAN